MSLRLHPYPGQEVENRTAGLVDDSDELRADLQQEDERADDDKRDPVAEARIRDGGLDHRARAEESGDRVDDQHRLAVAEAELLQAVVQMALVRLEDRLLLLPAPNDGEERVRQRHPDDQQRSDERDDRDLLKAEHGQRRQREAEEQRPRVAHEYFRRMEVEEQESADAAEQQRCEQNNRLVGHDDAHHEDGRDRDAGDAGRQPVEPVDQVDRVGDADDPDDRERDADPFAERLHGRTERNVQQIDLDAEAEDDDARRADLHEKLQLRVEIVFVVEGAEQHDQRAADEKRADQVAIVRAEQAFGNERHDHQQPDRERRVYRYASETRHRSRMDLAVIRLVDGSDFISQLLDERREYER